MGELWVAQKSIILYDRKVLLIQRSNYSSGENEWEIPGGGLRFGEDLYEGLTREIHEETGLSVRVDRLLYATTALVSPQRQIIGLTYLSHANTGEVALSREHKKFLWAAHKQLEELLNRPMLNDFRKHLVLEMLDIV